MLDKNFMADYIVNVKINDIQCLNNDFKPYYKLFLSRM